MQKCDKFAKKHAKIVSKIEKTKTTNCMKKHTKTGKKYKKQR